MSLPVLPKLAASQNHWGELFKKYRFSGSPHPPESLTHRVRARLYLQVMLLMDWEQPAGQAPPLWGEYTEAQEGEMPCLRPHGVSPDPGALTARGVWQQATGVTIG